MVKQIVKVSIALILFYVLLLQFQMWLASKDQKPEEVAESTTKNPLQKVYSFSFSKYDTNGKKELVIEGDSANIFSQNIFFINVLAKAFAEDSPITITADNGVFDKSTSNVHLHKNVIATTKTGTRLLSEELNIDPTSKTVETPVHAKVKRENINVEGVGATGDSELKKVNFKKNVTVVIQNANQTSSSAVPTVITSDGPLEIDYERNIAHFSKNVVAKDDRGTLVADFMDVFYSQATKKVYKIISTGNVVITNKDGHTTYSDNAIYLADEGKVILGGDVEAVGAKQAKEDAAKGSGDSSIFQLMGSEKPAKQKKEKPHIPSSEGM